MHRKRLLKAITILALFAVMSGMLASCSASDDTDKKTALKVIVIPKFEIDDMSGDFPGEAQLFYEKYCGGCEETEVPNMSEDSHFYVNEENGVGLLVCGIGKINAASSLTALLSSGLYDSSDAYIVSVGCAGGSASYCTLGDVVLATAVCDYDLGHHVDAHEKENTDSDVMWFPDEDYNETGHKILNEELCDRAYAVMKDCPLRTTDQAKEVMRENFPEMSEDEILPSVKKGTSITADDFWKGTYGHDTANYVAEYYECPDPFASTEMEEMALANTAKNCGMLDRFVSMRVIVNMDVFLNGATPESTWGVYDSFTEKVTGQNDETLDIFEPAMHNLFDTASLMIDAMLEGEL